MKTLQADWIAFILARNIALLILVAGGLHLWRWRWQGRLCEYNGGWQDRNDGVMPESW